MSAERGDETLRGFDMEEWPFECPWCGESNELLADPDERGQVMVVDCRVCCRPIEVSLSPEPGTPPRIRPEEQ